MIKLRRLILGAMFLLILPGSARAEVILTPFAGEAFSGSVSSSRTTYGASLAFLGGGVFGFEAEFSYLQDFFGDVPLGSGAAVSSNSLQSFSGNFMASLPTGAVRLYASGGLSLLQPSLKEGNGASVVDENKIGYNVGGGLMIFFGDHLGVRGDLRYFRSLQDLQPIQSTPVSLGSLDYWRGTVGVTLKY